MLHNATPAAVIDNINERRGLTLLAIHIMNCVVITGMYTCHIHYVSTSATTELNSVSATVRRIYTLGIKY